MTFGFSSRDYCFLSEHFSAKKTFTRIQLISLISLLIAVAFSAYVQWEKTVIFLSLLFSMFYLAVVLFRSLVLADFDKQAPIDLTKSDEHADGRYVVLVALYKEANQVPDLVASLDQLKWASDRKAVRLICEADDFDTINAIERQQLPANFELVIVPPGTPRTKPRALNYGLALVTGDYLVIYDAEDRPHPNQLLEAAKVFSNSPPSLACLQAPLRIDNERESFLTRLFSIEYDTLFLGILPALTKWKSPMPLGGTSNHFKLSALRKAGGWDSYNVTEDADLGIRLARFGMHTGVISSPTLEEAPSRIMPWAAQRTRWIKGWMQTLLVHMRNPLQTAKEMGWSAFLKFHLVLTSVVVSVLVHPFFLIAFIFQILKYFSGLPLSHYDVFITGVSTFNLVAGYTTYGMLAYAVRSTRKVQTSRFWILFLPVYWLLISIAGWRALGQLAINPHHWEKTTHDSQKRVQQDGWDLVT